jgi:parallel beta-helix repeat protein
MREKKAELASFALIGLILASILAGAASGAGVGVAEEETEYINIIDAGLPTTSFPNSQTPLPFMPNNNSLSSKIDVLLDDKPVFLFFYADWCHFCHQQLPIIDELEKEYAGKLAFIRINVNERPDYADEFGASTLPTMFFISGKNEEGYVKQEISGVTEKIRLKEIIDLEIGQSEQTVICNINEGGIPEDANYNSSIDEGESNSNVLSSLSSGIAYAGNYELLIIAPDKFIDKLKPLKDFKDATGRPTILLSLSEIYSNPSCTGVDDAEKIKKCIAHYVKSNGIEYVMLFGDCDRIPVRWYYMRTENATHVQWCTYYATDLYYGDLYDEATGSFCDWDYNNNKIYGEAHSPYTNRDHLDFHIDIAIGRVPASNVSEVNTYVDKIIRYELNTYYDSEWFKKALMVTGAGGGRYMPPSDITQNDDIASKLSLLNFNIIKLYNEIGYEQPNPVTINDYLNQGVGFVNVISHADQWGWGVYNVRTNMAGLTNVNHLPVIYSFGCHAGRFTSNPPWDAYIDVNNTLWPPRSGPYIAGGPKGTFVEPAKPRPLQNFKVDQTNQTPGWYQDSMPEYWLVKSNVGAVAFIGSQASGILDQGYAVDDCFFDAYKGGNTVLGDIWMSACDKYVTIRDPWHDREDFVRWARYNLFGDPSLWVGGLHDKKMTITHDTTLYPTTYNIPTGKWEGAITIGASNVVLDCNGAIINGTGFGYGIYILGDNVTIKNCNIKNFDYGIWMGSNSNTIINNNIYSNGDGVHLVGGVHNKIIGNDIHSNDDGVYLSNADSNELIYNTISNNDEVGVYLDMYSGDNNLISNIICSNSDEDISNNVNYGGPNYGDENTCSKVFKWNDNGTIGCTKLCEHTPTLYYCDSCSDCTNKINTAPPGSVIKLTKNIINHHETCIKWMGDGKTFDCQNHAIDGDDSTGDHIEGIYYTGIDMLYGPEGNTIKNCVISDFEYGIRMQREFGNASYYNNIINNTLYSNTLDGIKIDSSVETSGDFSIIKNNVIINNGEYGIRIHHSKKNLIDSNTVCSNTKSDFFLSDSYNNFGTNNYCDKPDGWNDAGETGCSRSCSKAPISCAPGEVIPYDDMEITSNTKLCRGFYNIPDSGDQGVIIIKSDNVILDCNGATINGDDSGIGIYNNGFDDVILKNCNIQNYGVGIGVGYSSYNTITSSSSSNNVRGIVMEYSSYNTLTSNSVYGNNLDGVYMVGSSNNTLTFNNVYSNNLFANTNGIALVSSSSNSLTGNNINDNSLNGIDINSNSDFNTLNNNKIKNNRYGVSLTDSNNTDLNANIICENTIFDLDLVNSYDNSGNNNYCDKSEGWSDTGTTGCTNPCAAAPTCAPDEVIPYDGLVVTKDTKLCHGFYNIPDSGADGVIMINAPNIVLDGNGAILNGTGSGFGIYNPGFDNVEIKNCTIPNYDRGIFLKTSNYNTILGSNLSFNDEYGIELFRSTGSTIAENVISSNGYHGILLFATDSNIIAENLISGNTYGIYVFDSSDNNEITGNEIVGNLDTGIYMSDCDPWGWCTAENSNNYIGENLIRDNSNYGIFSQASDSTIDQNIVCGNGVYDLVSDNWLTSSGDNNICNKPDGWNDAGTTGCTYPCPIEKPDLIITEIECDRENDRIGYVVKNIGNATAPAGHYTTLVCCPDDYCYSYHDFVDVDLNPKESYQGWFPVLPCDIELCVCADTSDVFEDDNLIEESNEDNNCREMICECCVTPTDDLYINSDTTLCPGVYNISDSGDPGVIIINADNVVLDCNGATLKGDNSGFGIYNPGFDNVTIKNGNVLNYEIGIPLSESDNNIISNNTVSYSGNQGISIESSHYCNVYDNGVSFSGDRGIVFGGGGNNAAYNNTVHNNSAYGAIEAVYSDNNEIYNNTAYFNRWGIATNHGSNNRIYDNTIFGNKLGVYLDWPSANNGVFNNNISSNNEGIWTNHNSTDNIIAGNVIFSNEYAGIRIDTDNNTITNNTANSNRIGLYLCAGSTGNTINYNTFCNNSWYDVRDEGSNSGVENTCDLTDNWNDAGTTGCTYSCIGKPDLVITEIECDRENDRIGYWIENIGKAAAPESHHTALLVKFGEAWEEMCYDLIDFDLNPGDSYQRWFECYTWPECQTIEVKVCADNYDVIKESDENNNYLENKCECAPLKKQDLEITDISHRDNRITYKIKNQGNAAAGSSTTYLYVDDSYKASDFIGSIPPGGTLSRSFECTYTCTPPSDTIKVCADATNSVAESNEANNCKTEVLTCEVPPPKLDIYFADGGESPGSVYHYNTTTEIEETVYTRPSRNLHSFTFHPHIPQKLYYVNANKNKIYRTLQTPSGWTPEEVVYTHTTYVRDIAFAFDKDGELRLYFSEATGAGENGKIYKIEDGKASLYYEVKLADVGGFWAGDFAFDDKDNLYLSSGNQIPASIYKVEGGKVKEIFKDEKECISGLIYANGALYYANWGTKIYQLDISTKERTVVYSNTKRTWLSDVDFRLGGIG